MAKKKDELKKVLFTKSFEGSLNDYPIKVQAGTEMKLPENIYQWIQKFKVCEDA
jgi:hypothetical protein